MFCLAAPLLCSIPKVVVVPKKASKGTQIGLLELNCQKSHPVPNFTADKDGKVRRKSIDDLEDLDPVTLAELGTRRGSRFSADGTPLFLKAFLLNIKS